MAEYFQGLTPQEWLKPILSELNGRAWTLGIQSDKRRRGEAVNLDVYDQDSSQKLAVVQIRQARFRPNRFTKVRKDYYLVGRNENGNAFAHPVSSVARKPDSGVVKALCEIWETTPSVLPKIFRNGDTALIPIRASDALKLRAQGKALPIGAKTIAESHLVIADEFFECGGKLYAAGRVRIIHEKSQHPTVQAQGVFRVAVGNRAATWNFTAPTAD